MTAASEGILERGPGGPRAVTLQFEPEALVIPEGEPTAARWPYADIRCLPAGRPLRVRSLSGPELPRLEIEDEAAGAELLRRAPHREAGAATDGRAVVRIVGW